MTACNRKKKGGRLMLRNILPKSALNFKDKINTPIRGSFLYSTKLKPLSDPGS